MTAPCKRENPKYLYGDEEYTLCSFCQTPCPDAIACFNCGRVNCVFYSRKYDLFSCNCCYERIDYNMRHLTDQ